MNISELIKKHEQVLDMSSMIDSYDYKSPDKNQLKIINNYKVPNKNYITGSARGNAYSEVELTTLDYIINKCFKCKDEEKYHAALVLLYKFYKDTKDTQDTNLMKENIISSFKDSGVQVKDFKYLDKYSSDNNELFYIVEITIGNNKILKYGIASKSLRSRFIQLKSNIRENYSRQNVDISPILIIECPDSEKFEYEVKQNIKNYEYSSTGYRFKGHTETLSFKHKEDLLKIIIPIAMKEFTSTIVYSEK